MNEPALVKNETEHRYELFLGDRLAAFAEYLQRGPSTELPHTVISRWLILQPRARRYGPPAPMSPGG